jgi:phosphoesterase RecJ-like protein
MLLDEMEIDSTGKIAWVTITSAHYAATNTTVEDVEDFINFPRSIKGVETAILFRESKEDLYKISFRSRGTIDVTRLALKFGGGGHKYAAGCTVKGSLNEVKEKVLQAAVSEIERIVPKKQKMAV